MSNLKSYLTQSGIKQGALAKQLGITAGYMSALVSGGVQPSLDLAVRIERATARAVPATSWVPEVEAGADLSSPKEDAA